MHILRNIVLLTSNGTIYHLLFFLCTLIYKSCPEYNIEEISPAILFLNDHYSFMHKTCICGKQTSKLVNHTFNYYLPKPIVITFSNILIHYYEKPSKVKTAFHDKVRSY